MDVATLLISLNPRAQDRLLAAAGALIQLFTPYYFMLIMVGIFMGLVTGIIPGVGGTVALALILPFTMKLDPAEALPLVIGLVSPVLTSDSIPAILIAAPGSASAAATMMDGFPMAKRGEAGRALGIAFTASAIGGVFGAVLIALSIPILKPLVQFFETREFLALSVLAISSVAILSGGSILKGIGTAGLGPQPAADDPRWAPTGNSASQFVVELEVLADTLRADPRGDIGNGRFDRWHTIFVRAIDNEDAIDPTPDYRTFNAYTLAPSVWLLSPALASPSVVELPRTFAMHWNGGDDIGDGRTQDPEAVRWAMVSLTAAEAANAALVRERLYDLQESAWSNWVVWGPSDSTRQARFFDVPCNISC